MSNAYHGLMTGRMMNNRIFLDYLLEAGPRIVRLGFLDHPTNLLAETPDISWETPHGRYHLYGGHRLWHAPESVDRTHIPDDAAPTINAGEHRVDIFAPVERPTGIQKSMSIHLDPNEPVITIEHTLCNQGDNAIELAVWPITQLPLGGVLILPQNREAVDPHGKLPNRSIQLWPYSRIQDPRVHLEDDVILLEAGNIPESNKIGYLNRTGWLAYLRGDVMLIKHFSPRPDAVHADMGCNVEAYLSGMFVEMETLSPLEWIEPGSAITHQERWELHRIPAPPASLPELLAALRSGSLRVRL